MNMQATIQQCVSISEVREILTGLKVHSRLFARLDRLFARLDRAMLSSKSYLFLRKFKSRTILNFLGRRNSDKNLKLSPDKGHI